MKASQTMQVEYMAKPMYLHKGSTFHLSFLLLLCLIEVFWNLSGLEGIEGAEDDEEHVVEEGEDDGEGGDGAGLQGRGGAAHRVQEDDLELNVVVFTEFFFS